MKLAAARVEKAINGREEALQGKCCKTRGQNSTHIKSVKEFFKHEFTRHKFGGGESPVPAKRIDLPGVAENVGNRHAEARGSEGHARYVAAREHPDDRRWARSARTLEDQSYANGYADAASHRNTFNPIPKTTL